MILNMTANTLKNLIREAIDNNNINEFRKLIKDVLYIDYLDEVEIVENKRYIFLRELIVQNKLSPQMKVISSCFPSDLKCLIKIKDAM